MWFVWFLPYFRGLISWKCMVKILFTEVLIFFWSKDQQGLKNRMINSDGHVEFFFKSADGHVE